MANPTSPKDKKGSFLAETPGQACRNFDRYLYCNRGTLCKYSHDYSKSNQGHIMAYLDAIVADISKLKKSIEELKVKEGLDTASTISSSSTGTPRRSRDTMVQKKARSRSRDKRVSSLAIPHVEPLRASAPAFIPSSAINLPSYSSSS